ncbi:hypothetical protein ECG_02103 [Echinococcus granulosus]|nr:hypothetical protein ECG_02103 [Echinococcus granulosus]
MAEIQVAIEAMEMLAIGQDPCNHHQFMKDAIPVLGVRLSLAHHVSMVIPAVKPVRGVTILDPQFVDFLIVRPEAGKYFNFVVALRLRLADCTQAWIPHYHVVCLLEVNLTITT